jgi:hypothetical protein
MKYIFVLGLFLITSSAFSQERVLKNPHPSMMELMHFEIKLNPNDTIFNSVDFSYLPVKGFPFYTASYKQPYYTMEQRDSILKVIDDMFFE